MVQRATDGSQQFVRIVRLFKVPDCAQFCGRLAQSSQAAGRDENERDISQAQILEPLRNRKSESDWHPDVHQDEVRTVHQREFKTAHTVRRGEHMVTGVFKPNGEGNRNLWIVFED